MNLALRADNLSKRYRLQHTNLSGGYRTLREDMVRLATAPFRRRRRDGEPGRSEDFWALRDVSFRIEPGEVVGIIGRNGAGKSTLLKLLSRITKPTTGQAEIYGRVGSLLEVGTGFHPELTGRENIFLNGSILGMGRREVARKFDEIVAFSEIEKFLDTPVKRYSSGMYVRLAFAVAAHLEPEILIVDEVLAVGDASFQKKCLGKMEDVSSHGRTVLFVSHNMNAITRLCPRTILLQEGRVIADGASHEVVRVYLHSNTGTIAARQWSELKTAPGNEIVRLCAVRVRDEEGRTVETLDIRRPVGIEMTFEVLEPGHRLVPSHHFINEEGICAFIDIDRDPAWRRQPRRAGTYTSVVWIPANFLAEGPLLVSSAVVTLDPVKVHFWERDIVAFHVVDSLDGDSARADYAGTYPGVVRPCLEWETRFTPHCAPQA